MYAAQDITVGENVFIGMRSIILPGTVIGDNVIIGAGSLVKGTIPSNTVWAGIPARQIQSIEEFSEKIERRGLFGEGDSL